MCKFSAPDPDVLAIVPFHTLRVTVAFFRGKDPFQERMPTDLDMSAFNAQYKNMKAVSHSCACAHARASVHMRTGEGFRRWAMIHQAVQVMRKPAPTAGGGEKSFAAYMARGKEQAVDNFVDSWLSQVDWSR